MRVTMKSLYQAAVEGSVPSLLMLLRDDPLLLDRSVVGPCTESPLHVASLLGHVEFVNEILSRKPQLALELDSQGSAPLHLAAAKGYLDIVKSLLIANPEMCFTRDKFGRNPIHVAAIKARLEVLREMIGVRPGAALQRMSNGDTILHLCVRNNRLDTLQDILGRLYVRELVNSRNGDGDTILHLATADQQKETVNFLINNTEIDMSSRNQMGLTALEISVRAYPPERDQRRDEKRGQDWPEKMRSALMVVSVLTATMAFQVGVNPPSGFWQENSKKDGQSCDVSIKADNYSPSPCEVSHKAGSSILASNGPSSYETILAVNTASFIASLSIILILISGVPLRKRFFVWMLMVIMWVAITCNALTYVNSIEAFTPDDLKNTVAIVLTKVTRIWVFLTGLLLIVHTVRLVIWFVRNVIKKRKIVCTL